MGCLVFFKETRVGKTLNVFINGFSKLINGTQNSRICYILKAGPFTITVPCCMDTSAFKDSLGRILAILTTFDIPPSLWLWSTTKTLVLNASHQSSIFAHANVTFGDNGTANTLRNS